jgi:tRNA A-37 threonylcarbamoyl transferase component Bud32
VLEIGQQVGNWIVEARLGAGAMAEVYRVRHARLARPRALKVLTLRHPNLDERLLKEGYVQANLEHPNVVRVYDLIPIGDSWGLLMDLVEGPRLDEWLNQAPRSLADREAVFRAIVAGVQAAHERGWVHRDLKPQNIMMSSGAEGWKPVVADFGMVKLIDNSDGSATRTGSALGTPAYMAPEQFNDASRADQRADIYALGCILYELCCGTPPFTGSFSQILQAHFNSAWLPPRQLVPELPERFVRAIEGAMVVSLEERLPGCQALLEVLDGAAAPPRAAPALSARLPADLGSLGEPGSVDTWTGETQVPPGTRSLPPAARLPAAPPTAAQPAAAPPAARRPADEPAPAARSLPRWVLPAAAAVLIALGAGYTMLGGGPSGGAPAAEVGAATPPGDAAPEDGKADAAGAAEGAAADEGVVDGVAEGGAVGERGGDAVEGTTDGGAGATGDAAGDAGGDAVDAVVDNAVVNDAVVDGGAALSDGAAGAGDAPARLTVNGNGVEVRDGSGAVVGEIAAGQSLELAPGSYELFGGLVTKVLFKTVELAPGQSLVLICNTVKKTCS